MHTGKGWQEQAAGFSLNEERQGRVRGCGCAGLVVTTFWWSVVLLSALGLSQVVQLQQQPPALYLVMGIGLLVCLPLAILPGRKKRQAEKQARRCRDVEFDPNSEWDNMVKAIYTANDTKRRRANRVAVVLLVLGLVGMLLLQYVFPSLLDIEDSSGVVAQEPFIYFLSGCIVFLWPAGVAYMVGALQFAFGGKKQLTRKVFKEQMVLPQLRGVFENPEFRPTDGFDKRMVTQSGVMGGAVERVTCNDYLKAVYRGTAFANADISATLLMKDKAGSGTHHETVFRGRWLGFKSRKKLQSGFYLWSKGFAGGYGVREAAKKGMQPVKLENPRFNDIFDVYAFTAHDAFLFLTPALMECLEGLMYTPHGGRGGHQVALVCVGGNVQVYVNGVEDAFEPPISVALMTEASSKARILRDAQLITDILDRLRDILL